MEPSHVTTVPRKRMENKTKFVFDSQCVVAPVASHNSVQSRLASRTSVQSRLASHTSVQSRLTRKPSTPDLSVDGSRRLSSCYSDSDPVLEEIVAKLQMLGDSHSKSKEIVKDCVCVRPMRLIMCSLCGETFPGRLRTCCPTHPK